MASRFVIRILSHSYFLIRINSLVSHIEKAEKFGGNPRGATIRAAPLKLPHVTV